MEQTPNPSRWLSTTTAVYIYAFLAGIPFGATGPATIQAINYLVSFELGFEAKNITSTGPCSEQANTTGNDEDNAAIQGYVSNVVLIGGMVGSLPALLSIMFLSSWSDGARSHKQLRFVALLPCIGVTLHMATFVVIFVLNLSPWWTLVASALLALGGGFYLQIATMLSYLMSSYEDKNDRSVYVIYLQTLNFSAQGIAQIGIGYMIEGAGFITSFVLLFFICLGTTVFVAIYPPILEVKTTDDLDNALNGKEAPDRDEHSVFKVILGLFRSPDTGKHNVILILYIVTLLLYIMLTIYFLILIQMYVLGAPFCWSPTLIGYFGVAKLASCALGLLIGAKVLKRYFDDNTLVQIGILSMLVSTVIPIYARTDAGLFLTAVFGCFRILPGAVITARVSNHAEKQHYGSLFGVTSAIEGLASFLAPLIFGSIYSATVAEDSIFVFKLMAGLAIIPSTLIMCIQSWNMTLGMANHKEFPKGALLAGSPPKK